MFNQPSAGSGWITVRDHLGHLVLITKVHRITQEPDNMKAGAMRDVACVDFVDLEGDQQLQERALIDKIGVVNRLTPSSEMVLGRIGQVPTDKGNPAFVLNEYTAGVDDVRAQQWVDAWQRGQFAQPQPSAAPAPAPAAAPQPASATPAPAVDADLAAILAKLGPEAIALLGKAS